MFGVSFGEVVLIAAVALVVFGPERLPEILGTLGKWIAKVRRMTVEVRRQTGIDEILRSEGLAGGLAELRSLVRGDLVGLHSLGHQDYASASPRGAVPVTPNATVDSYGDAIDFDRFRECPVEGQDSCGAIPEDLVAPVQVVAEPTEPTTVMVASAREPSLEGPESASDSAGPDAPKASP